MPGWLAEIAGGITGFLIAVLFGFLGTRGRRDLRGGFAMGILVVFGALLLMGQWSMLIGTFIFGSIAIVVLLMDFKRLK